MTNRKYYCKENAQSKPFIPHSWDLETDGLGGTLLCITACPSNPADTLYYVGPHMIDAFLDMAFAFPFTKNDKHLWISHNMSYDLRYIVEWILKNQEYYTFGLLGLRTQSSFWAIDLIRKVDAKVIRFADSYAFFPQSLKKFAEQFGGAHQKLDGPDFETVRFDPANTEHVAYALGDVTCLQSSIITYQETVRRDYGVELGYTAAGTAMKAWQATLSDIPLAMPGDTLKSWKDGNPVFYNKPPKWANKIARAGYFGGLVFLTDTNPHENAVTYDINSSYPAQMRKGVPSGTPAMTWDYEPDLPGFYHCIVKAPDDLVIAIVPRRDKNDRVHWNGGTFEVPALSTLEINFARSQGYEIETLEGVIWPDGLCFPFNDFVDKCEALRAENKGAPREVVAKLMQNSVYGKFATKEDRDVIEYAPDAVNDGDALLERLEEGWTPMTDDSPFFLRRENQADEIMAKPEWAAWITANARVALLRVAYAVGPENCLYGDTDSVTVTANHDASLVPCSAAYGDFKREKEWEVFRAIAPKVYAGAMASEWKGASKGQSKRRMKEQQYMEIFETGTTEVEDLQLESLRQVLKKGAVSEARLQKKVTSDILKNTSFEFREDGKVRPREVGQ